MPAAQHDATIERIDTATFRVPLCPPLVGNKGAAQLLPGDAGRRGSGVLRLCELPTAEQAEVIRDYLGIRKRRDLSEGNLEQLRHMRAEAAMTVGVGGSPSTKRG
jgi:hypothetical protein